MLRGAAISNRRRAKYPRRMSSLLARRRHDFGTIRDFVAKGQTPRIPRQAMLNLCRETVAGIRKLRGQLGGPEKGGD